jgi:hypothetical protein
MSDPEQKYLDVFNKNFMSNLSDSELNTWIKISKALKDTDLKNAGESGNKEQVYKLLMSKYQLSQQEFESAMQKYGEALMSGVMSGVGQAFEQGLQEGFTNQNQSAFSNFESSLNLDL